MKQDFEKLVAELRALQSEAAIEAISVEKVRQGDEYRGIEKEISELMSLKESLLPDTPVSRLAAQKLEELNDAIRTAGVRSVPGLKIKYKVSNFVNQNRVLTALGGDFGIYQELSTITQKALKDFAATQDATTRKSLLDCIEVESETYNGFEFQDD